MTLWSFRVQPVFFTDLDGTLLDHATYDFSPALPALSALKERKIPLILASSKTGSEITELRSLLGLNQWPAIIENGAGELAPDSSAPTDSGSYQKLRQILIPEGYNSWQKK